MIAKNISYALYQAIRNESLMVDFADPNIVSWKREPEETGEITGTFRNTTDFARFNTFRNIVLDKHAGKEYLTYYNVEKGQAIHTTEESCIYSREWYKEQLRELAKSEEAIEALQMLNLCRGTISATVFEYGILVRKIEMTFEIFEGSQAQ